MCASTEDHKHWSLAIQLSIITTRPPRMPDHCHIHHSRRKHGGVSTNHKALNRIELSELGQDVFNF